MPPHVRGNTVCGLPLLSPGACWSVACLGCKVVEDAVLAAQERLVLCRSSCGASSAALRGMHINIAAEPDRSESVEEEEELELEVVGFSH